MTTTSTVARGEKKHLTPNTLHPTPYTLHRTVVLSLGLREPSCIVGVSRNLI